MRLIPSSLRLRLFLFALLALLPAAGLLLFYRAGNHTFFENLVALLLTGTAVLAATWLGGTFLVIRPVRSLLAATLKVGQGDLMVRTGLVLCTLDMRFVDANPTFANIIGRTVEEVKRLAYAEISPRVPDPEEARGPRQSERPV